MNKRRNTLQRIKIPAFLGKSLAKPILDFAETLPEFQSGIIAFLQRTRKSQRDWANRTHERTRPPEGLSIDFLGFCLFELFQFEQFEKLLAQIHRTFPDERIPGRARPIDEFFEDVGWKFTSTGFAPLGHFVKGEPDFLSFPPIQHIENLPDEIDRIAVGVHKILPSVIVLSYYAFLKPEGTKNLVDLQNSRYLRDVIFNEIYLDSFFISHSRENPDNAMRAQIQHWFESLVRETELVISKYFNGLFLRNNDDNTKLPGLLIFGMNGDISFHRDRFEWFKEAEPWLSSMGIEILGTFFANNNVAFLPAREHLRGKKNYARLLVSSDNFFGENGDGKFADDRHKLQYHFFELAHSFLSQIVLDRFLDDMLQKVDELRSSIYSLMEDRTKIGLRLRKYLRAYHRLMTEKILFSRLAFEIKENWILFEGEFSDEDAFITRHAFRDGESEEEFPEASRNHIQWKIRMISDQIKILFEGFDEYVNLLNINVLYRLQWITVLLTLFGILVAIGSLNLEWDRIIEGLRRLIF